MTQETKHAIIISLTTNTTELAQLADTLGYQIQKTFIQNRTKPDPNGYIGSGKVDEIKEYLEDADPKIDLIIVNDELKPSQWFTLEKALDQEVYDRVRLILAIFAEHAERQEARLQVKLAQLQYERPHVRELIHRARAGEHPGLMAGGEYQVDDYYEMIKRQVKKIGEDLEKIRETRELQRRTRTLSGFYAVSLAGYTNAGKSSLMNAISGGSVKVEERLFSTLSTTTRNITGRTEGKSLPILLTDTVGFIENLPASIVDAFHSTLEEIELADVVIVVVDGSETPDLVTQKLEVSLAELRELGVEAPLVIAVNKIDLLSAEALEHLMEHLAKHEICGRYRCIPISAKARQHIDVLLDAITVALPHQVELTMQLPATKDANGFVSELYQKAKVMDVSYEEGIVVRFSCHDAIKGRLIAQCLRLGGSVLEEKAKTFIHQP
jgi:GTPase